MAPWTGWMSGCSISEYDRTVEKHKSTVRRTQGAGGADRQTGQGRAGQDRTGQRGRDVLAQTQVQAQAQAQAQQGDGARGCRSRRWRRVFMQQK